MKTVFTFLVALGVSLVDGAAVRNQLQAPQLKKTIIFDPAGIRLQWEPVEGRKDDPITGYRLKVWELSKKVYSIEYDDNGRSKTVEKTVAKDTSSFDYTKEKPKWIVDVGPEASEAEVNDVILDIFYELKVQALTENEEGPLSDTTIRVAINGPK